MSLYYRLSKPLFLISQIKMSTNLNSAYCIKTDVTNVLHAKKLAQYYVPIFFLYYFTFTLHFTEYLPALTVIVTIPVFLPAVILPLESTVAIAGLGVA